MGADRVKVSGSKRSGGRTRPPQSILARLAGGDRRSIGEADQVAAIVSREPTLFPELMAALWSEDLLVRMRAADAAEKVSRKNPELLASHKAELLGLMSATDQQELRWHLAAMVPRLALNAKDRQRAVACLKDYLNDRSSIVKTFALNGLADLARSDSALLSPVIELLRQAERTGTPAMKARSRRLLLNLERG
jgi:hypothetical protein